MDRWRRTIETGQPYDIEHRLRRADGAYRWFQARGLPQRDGKGSILRWYNLLTDIDDGKRAEEALRSDEQRLRQILDNIPGPVSMMNEEVNSRICQLANDEYFGKTAEELKNWATSDGIHPEDLPRYWLGSRRLNRATGRSGASQPPGGWRVSLVPSTRAATA